MPVWEVALDIVGVALLLGLLYGISLIVRRRILARNGGTFELSHRRSQHRPGRGWQLGIGRYNGDTLEWFRIFSISPNPKQVWARDELTYAGRRAPEDGEELALYSGHVVVSCTYRSAPIEIAMSTSALTGFQSWLEAGPPGTDWNRR